MQAHCPWATTPVWPQLTLATLPLLLHELLLLPEVVRRFVDLINIGTGNTSVAGGKTIHIGDGTPTGTI